FILSILRANPSLRDAKSYLSSFGVRSAVQPKAPILPDISGASPPLNQRQPLRDNPVADVQSLEPVATSILDPIHRRTALVKIQGPFTNNQLDSIARGMVYLEKLGLLSVIVVENDIIVRGDEGERTTILKETMRLVTSMEKQGARVRPILDAVVRLGPNPHR